MHRSTIRSLVRLPLLVCGVVLAIGCGGATPVAGPQPAPDQGVGSAAGAGSATGAPAAEVQAVVQVPPVSPTAPTTKPATGQPTADEPPPAAAEGRPCPAERNMTPATIPERIEASHIVVGYLGARKAGPLVRRSKDEARARAHEVLARLCQGAKFADMVRAHSDEPGAADRDGKLGRFPHRAMVKPFADAAFALQPGELSPVVETAFGFHIILRTK